MKQNNICDEILNGDTFILYFKIKKGKIYFWKKKKKEFISLVICTKY